MKHPNISALAERHDISIVYLFGSQSDEGKRYLEGDTPLPDPSSDLDIAVVLDPPPTDAIKAYGILYREFSKIFEPFSIDLLFMHEINPLLQYEIIKGLRIYARNESYTDDFEERILKMAEDLSFKKKIFNNDVMEAVEVGYFEFEYKPNS